MVSREFHAASQVREAAAQERLLAIARKACTPAFITELGRAIWSNETQTLTCPVNLGKYRNQGEGMQGFGENPNPHQYVPLPSGPQGLWLEGVTYWAVNLLGARCTMFRFAIQGAVTGECMWGYVTVYCMFPHASPHVLLWIDAQHAIPMVSLLCCACVDGMPGAMNTPNPFQKTPISRKLLGEVRELLRGLEAGPGRRADGDMEMEDELLAGALLLNRYLGSVSITMPLTLGEVEARDHFLVLVLFVATSALPKQLVYIGLLAGIAILTLVL